MSHSIVILSQQQQQQQQSLNTTISTQRQRRRRDGTTTTTTSTTSSSPHRRRSCSSRTWFAAAATTTLAMSLSYTSAFQTTVHTLKHNNLASSAHQFHYPYDTNTRRWTMTDPDILLGMSSSMDSNNGGVNRRQHDDDVEWLNSAYMASPDEHDVNDFFFVDDDGDIKPSVKKASKARSALLSSKASSNKKVSSSKPQEAAAKKSVRIKSKRLTKASRSSKKPTVSTTTEKTSTVPKKKKTITRNTIKKAKTASASATTRLRTSRTSITKAASTRRYRRKSSSTTTAATSKQQLNNPNPKTSGSTKQQPKKNGLGEDTTRLLYLYDNLKLHLNREPTNEEFCAAAGKINLEAIQQVIASVSTSSVQLKSTRNVVNRDGKQKKKSVGKVVGPITLSSASTTTITTSATVSTEKTVISSKSSTMPGFQNRQSQNDKEYDDSLRLMDHHNPNNHAKKQKRRQQQKMNGEKMYTDSNIVPDSLLQFAKDIHDQTTRITPEEEKVLGHKCQDAMKLQILYDSLKEQLGRAPTDDEWCNSSGIKDIDTLQSIVKDGIDAKNQLVTANLRMVQSVVNVYIRNGLDGRYNAADLMQEGTMALIHAAEKFEPERGFRFSTYAMYWIRASVKRSQVYQSRPISVPQRLHENHKRIKVIDRELTIQLGRKPTKEELSTAVDMTTKQLDRCLKAMSQECHSLDSTLQNKNKSSGDNSHGTMYELVDTKYEVGSNGLVSSGVISSNTDSSSSSNTKTGKDNVNDTLDQLFMKEDLIETLFRHLKEEQVYLLLLRFGLMDPRALPSGYNTGGPLTIAQVSSLVGLKPDKVRRNINKSLKQIKDLIEKEWETGTDGSSRSAYGF